MTIHADSLGIPVPEATISCLVGRTTRVTDASGTRTEVTPDRWLMHTTAVSLQAPAFASAEEGEAWAVAHGWAITSRDKDLYGKVRLHLTHPETVAELDRRVAAVQDKWATARPCYVRYGRLPPDGRSRNHADGSLEGGVSVFRGQVLPSGEARALPSGHVEFVSMLSLEGRPLYIVAGHEVGVGSDGEPVLARCRIVRKARV